MLDPRVVADELAIAARERKPIRPFSEAHPDFDVHAAYAAQSHLISQRVEAGERLIGAKLGLTSRAKQEAMGVDRPLYGWLTSGMVLQTGRVGLDALIHPRAEPEIAFVLRDEVTGPTNIAAVLSATEGVCAAIEILDSRYEDFRFELPDVVADNASAAGLVLGPLLRRPDQLVDLRLVGCVLTVDGRLAATAAGAAVMGHPAAAVVWLANRLAEQGRSIPAGSVVLSGGLTNAFPIAPGGHVAAELDGLGTVEVWA